MNKIALLLITLFCITCSFLVGYYFWRNLSIQEVENLKQSLQISLHPYGNTIDVEKSEPSMRIFIDGRELSGTGTIEMKKE